MNENAIKQRVRLLEALWESEIRNHQNKDVILCCIKGTGIIDYRMIKGFVYVQMSDESILPDVFLFSEFPFKNDNVYGVKIVEGINIFIHEWNKKHLPNIQWEAQKYIQENYASEVAYLGDHLISLAESLEVHENEETLTFTFMPEPAINPTTFVQWITQLAQYLSVRSRKIRLLVYDSYDSSLYKESEKILGRHLLFLYPDLDMPGAISQIAEQMQSTATDPEKKDLATFQNNLLKMTSAIGKNESKDVLIHKNTCLQIADKNKWYDMSGITHFFCHTFYQANSNFSLAEQEINTAIDYLKKCIMMTDDAEAELPILLHYIIAQANLYLIDKRYSFATHSYREALNISQQLSNIDPIVINGIYQMLGRCYYESQQPLKSFDTLAEGWTKTVEQNTAFIYTEVAKYYIADMIKYNMDRKENYKYIFNYIQERLGNNWYLQIPKTAEDYENNALGKLNLSVTNQ